MLIILQLYNKMNNKVKKGATLAKVAPLAGWHPAVSSLYKYFQI